MDKKWEKMVLKNKYSFIRTSAIGRALRIALRDPALLCLDLLSRGFGCVSLSSKHVGFFFAREEEKMVLKNK